MTDLGTEFGVEVNREGCTKTHVFVGAVGIAAIGTRQHWKDDRRSCVQATLSDAMEWESVYCDQAGRQRLFVSCRHRHNSSKAEAYAKLVLSMNPAAYYRMDDWPKGKEHETCVLVDSAPGGHHGVVHLDRAFKPYGAGRFGKALDLHGSAVGDYGVVNDFPQTDTGQLSFSAWVLAWAHMPWDVIACEHNVDAPTNGWDGFDNWQFCVNLYGDDNNDLCVNINQRNKMHVELREGGSQPLPWDKWQHVAFVADGSVLHLYRNGREVASMPCDGVCRVPAIRHLTIGCKDMRKSWDAPDLEPGLFWPGYIDELAIFNHALSAAEVRQLFTGQPREPTEAVSETSKKP